MTTAEYARAAFAESIEYSLPYGPEQVAHNVRTHVEEFPRRALELLAVAARDAFHPEGFAALVAGAPEGRFSMLSLGGTETLLVSLENGRRFLMPRWDAEAPAEGKQSIRVGLAEIAPDAPGPLTRAIEEALASGTAPSDELVEQAARHGGFHEDGDPDLYGDLPLSLDDVRKLVETHGIENVCHGGVGSVALMIRSRGEYTYTRAYGRLGQYRDVATLAAVMSAFGPGHLKVPDENFELMPHRQAAIEGRLEELHASACAMLMDHTIGTSSDRLAEIVAKSAELGFSRTHRLAYNDTDIRIYAERIGDADVWFHDNIDLIEGNAFVTVLRGETGNWSSVDVYLSRAWYHETHDWHGGEASPEDARSTFLRRVERQAEAASGPRRIGEDALLAALEAGDRPTEGLALSYDIKTGAIETYPNLAHTDYVTYLPLMVEYGLKRLREASTGNLEDTHMYVHLRDGDDPDYERVPVLEFLAAKAPAP